MKGPSLKKIQQFGLPVLTSVMLSTCHGQNTESVQITEAIDNTSCMVASVVFEKHSTQCVEEIVQISHASERKEAAKRSILSLFENFQKESHSYEEWTTFFNVILTDPTVVEAYPILEQFPKMTTEGRTYMIPQESYDVMVQGILESMDLFLFYLPNKTGEQRKYSLFSVANRYDEKEFLKYYETLPEFFKKYGKIRTIANVDAQVLALEPVGEPDFNLVQDGSLTSGLSYKKNALVFPMIHKITATMMEPDNRVARHALYADFLKMSALHEYTHEAVFERMEQVFAPYLFFSNEQKKHLHVINELFSYTLELEHSAFPHAQLARMAGFAPDSTMGKVAQTYVYEKLYERFGEMKEQNEHSEKLFGLEKQEIAHVEDFVKAMNARFQDKYQEEYRFIQGLITEQDIQEMVAYNYAFVEKEFELLRKKYKENQKNFRIGGK